MGNTARIARAIAEGIGPDAQAPSTPEAIAERLERAGYASVAKPTGFVVAGRYGPLRDSEVERARKWGAELATALR